MAERAVIQLIVDSNGAIKAVGATNAEFKDLKEEVKKLEKELGNLSDATVAGIITPQKSAQQEARLLEKHLRSMIEKGVDPASAGFQRYSKVLDQMKAEQNAATNGLRGLGHSGDRAGMAMLDMTRIVEDSAFGIRGMANNINPAIQSFGRLRAETGSVGGALKAMAGSMLGPGGIMFAIAAISSALIAFGPQIKEFFAGAASEAEEFAKAVREAMDSMLTLSTEVGKFEVSGADAAKALAEIQAELIRQREIEAAFSASMGLDDVKQAKAMRDQIKSLEGEEALFREILDKHNAMVAASERLAELGATRAENARREGSGQAPLAPLPQATIGDPSSAFTARKFPGVGNMPKEAEEAEDAMDKLFSRLVQIQRRSAAGLISPQDRAKAEVQAIRQGLEAMVAEGIDPSSEAFRQFLDMLDEAEGKATTFADRFAESFSQIQQVAQQAGQVLGALFNSMHQSRMNEIERERRARIGSIDAQLKNERLSERKRTDLLEQRNAVEEQIREQTREAQREQAKRQKILALFEIAMNTASAIVEALPNVPLSITVGALGAVQLGIVASTPVPEFRRGGDNIGGVVKVHRDEIISLPDGSNVISQANSRRMIDALERPSIGGSFSDERMVQHLQTNNNLLSEMSSRMTRLEVHLNLDEFDEHYARFQSNRERMR